jgi:alkylglycerol monooxygenase
LPLVGFHPTMVMGILVAHGMYSFFTHTQVIKAPKWLEYVFITPSLHGVHHASDEKYLDKNYGDVFVFWDKMFGTFQKEEEAPKYGLTHPIGSYSFLWQHFHYYLEIYEAAKRQKGIMNKLRVVFGSPALMDQDIRPELEKRFFQKNTSREKFNSSFKKYINTQLFVVSLILMFFSAYFSNFDGVEKIIITLVILITLVNIGALLEQRKWIYYLEYIRVILIIGFTFYEFGYTELVYIPILILIILEQKLALKEWYLYDFLNYRKTE